MTTRSQRKSKTSESPSTPVSTKRIENSWILFLKEELFENDNFVIITLPHPANGKPLKICLDKPHKKLYEVMTFNEPYRSWFIGETVKSDGSIQMVTPLNPLFLVLPLLRMQCKDRAVPLEDLLSVKGYDKILDFINNLESIGDLRGSSELKAYKYNEEKTLSWLEKRVRNVAKILRKKNIHVTSGAALATFVTSSISNDSVDEEFFLKYAYGMVSEYLEEEVAELLEKRFDFKPNLIESVGTKRKSEANADVPNKKIKNDSNEGTENMMNNFNQVSNEVKKSKPLTSKEKARQKAASGTKTISAFFTKK